MRGGSEGVSGIFGVPGVRGSLRLIAFLAALLGAFALPPLVAQAQLLDIEGAIDRAVPSGTAQQATVVEGLSLNLGDPLDVTQPAQIFAVSDVLFIPINDAAATAQPWHIAVQDPPRRLRGTVTAVRLTLDAGGAVEAIDKLSSVPLAAEGAPLLAIPGAATHLELAVSEPARILLTPQDIQAAPLPETATPGLWLRAAPTGKTTEATWQIPAPLDPGTQDGQRLHVQAQVVLPDNYSATLKYITQGKTVTLPLTAGAAIAPALPSDRPLSALALDLSRPKVFADDPWPAFLFRVDLAPVDVDETEPNDSAAAANSLGWAEGDRRVRRKGFVTRRDPDFWRFTVGPDRAQAGLVFKADLNGGRGTLALLTDTGARLALVQGTDRISLENVVLPQGQYVLELATDRGLVPYTLSAKARRLPKDTEEREPNGAAAWSQDLALGVPIEGTAPDGDTDLYRFTVTEPGRLYGFQVSGGAALALKLDTGAVIQSQPSNRDGHLTRIAGQRLPRGTYLIEISQAARYALLARDLGPVPDDFEPEPNNGYFDAPLLDIGQATRGGFGSSHDQDFVAFSTQVPQYIRLRIQAPDDTAMRAELLYKSTLMVDSIDLLPGTQTDQVFFLEPGDYAIGLSRLTTSLSRDLWTVALDRPDFSRPFEIEPNAETPHVLAPGERVTGNQYGLDRYDSYLIDLPADPGRVFYSCATLQGTEVEVAVLPQGTRWARKLLDFEGMGHRYRWDDHAGGAGARYAISHRGWGAGAAGYDCAARWDSPETRAKVLQAAPVLPHPLAVRAGRAAADRLGLPARLSYVFDGRRQAVTRRLDLPPGVEQIAVTCEGPDGTLYVHGPDGTSLGHTAGDGTVAVIDAAGQDHLYIRGWANRFREDEPTLRCGLWAAAQGAPVGPAPGGLVPSDTASSDPAPGTPVPEQVLTHRPAPLTVTTMAQIPAAILPGDLGDRLILRLERDRPTLVEARCARQDPEGAEAPVVQKVYRLEPGKPVEFRADFRGLPRAVIPISCQVLDLETLPMLPLGDILGDSPEIHSPPVLGFAGGAVAGLAPFAALLPVAQAQTVTLEVTNPNAAALEVNLSGFVDGAGWQVTVPQAPLMLAPGATQAVEIGLSAPGHLGLRRPPTLLVTGQSPSAPRVRADLAVPVALGVPPVAPRPDWPIPEALAGGVNVAWAALGGRIVALDDQPLRNPAAYDKIIDGNGPRREPIALDRAGSLTVDLAGDAPVPVAGIAYTIRPQAIDYHTPPRRITVSVSRNGTDFEPLGAFDPSTTALRQIFAFDAPVLASHLRLGVPECANPRHCLPTTELMVIADPGWDGAGQIPFNLADPALGGVIVGADLGETDPRAVLRPEDRFRIAPPESGPEPGPEAGGQAAAEPPADAGSFVLGFFRARAPELTRIEWHRPAEIETEVPYITLAIGNSPMAPDQMLGRLDRPAAGETAVFDLPLGTAARYVFVTVPASDQHQHGPQHLRVIERAPGPDYRSILGLWPEDDPRSYGEWAQRHAPLAVPELPTRQGGTQTAPHPLPAGARVASTTWKETTPDWYGLPAGSGDPGRSDGSGDPVLRVLTLEAPQIVEVGARLIAEDGTEVPLVLLDDLRRDRPELEDLIEAAVRDGVLRAGGGAQPAPGDPNAPNTPGDQVHYAALLDPGQSYRLRIAEEGRLLILRREVTGMLSRDESVRRRAYTDLAALMGDGRDGVSINVPGRDGDMILRGEEEILFAMSRVPRASEETIIGTGDFGTALAADADRLRRWPGGKGIVYYGMGAGMAQVDDLDWPFQVKTVPARTAAILVSCDDGNFFCPDAGQVEPYPMHFAAALGGRFLRTVSRNDIRDGLLSAARALQGPKPYAVTWRDLTLPPAPAQLTLVSDPVPSDLAPDTPPEPPQTTEGPQADTAQAPPAPDVPEAPEKPADTPPPAPAVALVLDASGSMLKRLNGTRRIAIAKEALGRLVNDTIPPTTQVSFRAFGLEKDGCRTEQLAPLAPLDRAALNAAISGVQAINLAKTPIARSLEAAAADIAGALGPRSILLLTDGEETCDGSVDDTLARLEAAGLEVTLHIVGFAIDDAALKAQFERWAGITGGVYLDAQDATGLEAAVAQAVEVAVAPPPPPAPEPDPAPPPTPEPPRSAQLVPVDPAGAPRVIGVDDPVTLPPGVYRLILADGRRQEITLDPGAALKIPLSAFADAPKGGPEGGPENAAEHSDN